MEMKMRALSGFVLIALAVLTVALFIAAPVSQQVTFALGVLTVLAFVPGLRFMRTTSAKRTVNLAAYHSPHSLTWSWILSASVDGITRKGDGWLRFGIHPHRTNGGLQIVVALPWLCIHWHKQRAMWFRDLYQRERDERDGLAMPRATAPTGHHTAALH